MTDGSERDQFWGTLGARLLHSMQVEILEAMLWIDYPLSASALAQVFDGKIRSSTIAYHVLRLDSLRALKKVGKREPLRGSPEKLYRVRLQ